MNYVAQGAYVGWRLYALAVSHVAHVNESCHIYGWVTLYASCRICDGDLHVCMYERVMSHIRMRHKSHIGMRHAHE